MAETKSMYPEQASLLGETREKPRRISLSFVEAIDQESWQKTKRSSCMAFTVVVIGLFWCPWMFAISHSKNIPGWFAVPDHQHLSRGRDMVCGSFDKDFFVGKDRNISKEEELPKACQVITKGDVAVAGDIVTTCAAWCEENVGSSTRWAIVSPWCTFGPFSAGLRSVHSACTKSRTAVLFSWLDWYSIGTLGLSLLYLALGIWRARYQIREHLTSSPQDEHVGQFRRLYERWFFNQSLALSVLDNPLDMFGFLSFFVTGQPIWATLTAMGMSPSLIDDPLQYRGLAAAAKTFMYRHHTKEFLRHLCREGGEEAPISGGITLYAFLTADASTVGQFNTMVRLLSCTASLNSIRLASISYARLCAAERKHLDMENPEHFATLKYEYPLTVHGPWLRWYGIVTMAACTSRPLSKITFGFSLWVGTYHSGVSFIASVYGCFLTLIFGDFVQDGRNSFKQPVSAWDWIILIVKAGGIFCFLIGWLSWPAEFLVARPREERLMIVTPSELEPVHQQDEEPALAPQPKKDNAALVIEQELKCAECGGPVSASAKFCVNCGVKQVQ